MPRNLLSTPDFRAKPSMTAPSTLPVYCVPPAAKCDLVATQPARYRHGAVAARQRAGKALIVLLNDELALGQFPHAGDFRRHDPETAGAKLFAVIRSRKALVGIPVADGKGVGDDARAGFKRQQLRPQSDIHFRRQKQYHDAGFRDVRCRTRHRARMSRDR